MSTTPTTPVANAPGSPRSVVRTDRRARTSSLLAHGEPSVWLTGGALVVSLAMIVGLMTLIVVQGMSTYWPGPLTQVKSIDGKAYLGEVVHTESYRPEANATDTLPAEVKEAIAKAGGSARRRELRTENFEITGTHHQWVSDFQIADETQPVWALIIERDKGGNFYGIPTAFLFDGNVEATEPAEVWAKFNEHFGEVQERVAQIKSLAKVSSAVDDGALKDAGIAKKEAELRFGTKSDEYAAADKAFDDANAEAVTEKNRIDAEIAKLNTENNRWAFRLTTADGKEATLPLASIVRAFPANQLTFGNKLGVYFSRWGEFLSDWPRESNTAGGVFPAIWGTVLMTLMLALAVVPFGVLAALYLREYARSGPVIVAVRIAINNLAGVPSIVYGVFGMGFFCYLLGAFIDGGPERVDITPWPSAQWMLMLMVVIVLGLIAFCVGIAGARTDSKRSRLAKLLSRSALVLWLATVVIVILLIAKSPHFHGFYRANNGPVFGSGGLLWAALTLALLTLPVVIVATEEALSAVPNSMREGSYACGASKWQTIRRIVLPRALPGIMTGMILAMARGAGEVAPLMLVGAVHETTHLPFHLSQRFMHLGYVIYDSGFQSPNSEAARPMVYTTTLLLIAIVAVLNVLAVWLRSRLRKRFRVSQF